MKRSRRSFLKILAAGSAAVATRPAAGLAATRARRAPAAKAAAPAHATAAPPPAALRAEIERQRKDLDKILKTLREFPLPPGSSPAFVFRPLRATRAGTPR
jgi:hypothetical protein